MIRVEHRSIGRRGRETKYEEPYGRLGARLRTENFAPGEIEWPLSMTQLFGAPASIHRRPEEAGSALGSDGWTAEFEIDFDPALGTDEAWLLLLELDDDLRLPYPLFDSGALWIIAPAVDLAENRLDRAIFDVQT